MSEQTENAEVIEGKGYALVPVGHVLHRETRKLEVKLTLEEVRAHGRRVGALFREQRRTEADFESTKKDFKARIDAQTEELKRLGDVLDREAETRDVECITVAAYDEDAAITKRCDTGEEIVRRPLTNEERTPHLKGLDLEPESDRPTPHGRNRRGR